MEKELIIYEYPIDAKIRLLLRYEYLQKTVNKLMKHESLELEIIKALHELASLVVNSDLKNILLITLQNQYETMCKYNADGKADSEKVARELGVLDSAREQVDKFFLPREMEEHYLRDVVKRRIGALAGTCSFDLPVFYAWLHSRQNDKERDMRSWYAPFKKLDAGVSSSLLLTRLSGVFKQEQALNGRYSRLIEGKEAFTALRLRMDRNSQFFPEFSAGRHQMNLYFMQVSSFDKQPRIAKDTFNFELAKCSL